MRRVGVLLVVACCAACNRGSSPGAGTPGAGLGPALDIAVLAEVPCPGGVPAAACFKVRVTNHGSTGDGTCTLLADFTTSNGDRSVEGPRLDVSGLASGAWITKTLAWRTALPTGPDRSFRGLCSPGLSS